MSELFIEGINNCKRLIFAFKFMFWWKESIKGSGDGGGKWFIAYYLIKSNLKYPTR